MVYKKTFINFKKLISVIPVIICAFTFRAGTCNEGPNGTPDLIVGIVVEKMRYDYLARMWDMFGDNGFKKLVSEGTVFSNARYGYLVNQSSAGYATVFTGAYPSAHGIIADQWYDRLKKRVRTSVADENFNAVGGSYANGGFSPNNLFAGTIGDELRMASDFRSRVFTVAMDPHASVLSGGFSANSAWWFDQINGTWMTSSYYTDSLPLWVEEFNSKKLPDAYLDRRWEPLYRSVSQYDVIVPAKNEPFMYDLKRIRRRGDDYALLRKTPYGNTLTRDFALALIVNEQLGRRESTDMIVLGFSAGAEIGIEHGVFSMELKDSYIRLDKEIAHLLEFIDEHFGRSGVLLFLTSDRAAPYPQDYSSLARIPSGIFSFPIAMSLLRSYLNIYYGPGPWVESCYAGMVYLNHDLIEDNNILLNEIQDRASRFMNRFEGIAGVVTEDVLRRSYFSGGIAARVQAGFHPARGGDIMIYLRQGWQERALPGEQPAVVSYDQHVPLLFYGWNIEKKIITREVSTADIAPTLSRMLNIPLPPFATGTPLKELIR